MQDGMIRDEEEPRAQGYDLRGEEGDDCWAEEGGWETPEEDMAMAVRGPWWGDR